MYSDYDRETRGSADRDLILKICEPLTDADIRRGIEIFSDGGAAFHEQAVFRLLKYHGKASELERIGGMFTSADFPLGFADPRMRAALFLGIHELLESDGTISQEKALSILKRYEVPESPDLRDNLAAYAKKTASGSLTWSVDDFFVALLSVQAAGQLLRKVPWTKVGRLVRMAVTRGR